MQIAGYFITFLQSHKKGEFQWILLNNYCYLHPCQIRFLKGLLWLLTHMSIELLSYNLQEFLLIIMQKKKLKKNQVKS